MGFKELNFQKKSSLPSTCETSNSQLKWRLVKAMVFPVVWMWELDYEESWAPKNWCFWTMVLEKTLEESLELQGDPTSPSWRRSVLGVHWKDWCWRWNSNTLATSCKELTHWKRPWCWAGLGAGGEGDDRGWDGWMASPAWWTWVWVNSRSWWWTGRPGVLRFMGLQRVRHDWATELTDWLTEWNPITFSRVKGEWGTKEALGWTYIYRLTYICNMNISGSIEQLPSSIEKKADHGFYDSQE